MRRRVALWYVKSDSEWAESFRARWAKHLNVEHADGPPPEVVDPECEMEAGCTTAPSDRARVVILLVGAVTAEHAALMDGVAKSLERGDAVIAACVPPTVSVPGALYAAGCEILDWDSAEMPAACERAIVGMRRAPSIIAAAENVGTDDDECARAPTVVVEGDPVPVPE
jgi:hypothetical protein